MKNVAIISVFVMAIGAAAANDCETLINQFEETGNACYESCYAAGRVREGIVQIAEVSRRNMQLRNKRPGHNGIDESHDFRGTPATTTAQ